MFYQQLFAFVSADAEDAGHGDRDAEQAQAEVHRDDQQQQQLVQRVDAADPAKHQLKEQQQHSRIFFFLRETESWNNKWTMNFLCQWPIFEPTQETEEA